MKLFKANKRFLERENKIDEIPAILVFNNKKTKILYDMNKIEVDDFFLRRRIEMSINVKEIAIKFIALVLAVAFLLPGNILANKEQKEIDQETRDIKTIVKYITIDKHNKAVFHKKKAIKEGVNKVALDIGDSFMKYYGDIVNTENGSSTKKRRSGLYMATIADLDIRDQENPLID